MVELTQDMLEHLMICGKSIVEPPRREFKYERGSFRNNMKCLSLDGEFQFNVFMRINKRFNENFSIGMDYLPENGGATFICRYNGPHEQTSDAGNRDPHYCFHIHKHNLDIAECGLRPEKHAIPTNEYINYDSALLAFIKDASITNAHEHFKNFGQLKLFDEEL